MATFIELLLPSIHDVLSLREALSKLAQCERHFKTHGVCSIIENFNIIYSCLHHKNDLKEETLDEILNTLIRGLVIYESEVKKIINDRMSNDERIKYLNSLKMLTYLVIEFTNFVEKKQIGSKDNDLIPSAVANKKSGKKQTAATKKAASNNLDISLTCNSNFDWNTSKEKILDALSKVLQMNLQKLWDPPIVEEQFVIFVTNLCYKLMENLSSNSLRAHQKKIIKDHLCHILGLTIKKYNHSYGACVMIIQTLPHYDHFSSLYADLIETCVVQLGYESILPDLLREFHHTNLSNGTNANSGKDNPNLKYYSQFLIDLSDRLAKYLTPYLSLIQDFLEEESYLMRSCVLTCYGEQITKILNQQAITTDLKLREMRNELLDTLIDHIHDENAMTRSRTLQIWSNICKENSIPLSYMTELMKRCVGRMQDTAVSVRKSAFQLLCDLIRRNPYGIESSVETTIETIEVNLEKEEDYLKKLCEENDNIAEEINNNSKRVVENLEEEEEEGEQDEAINKTITENENEFELQKKKEKCEENILIQKSKLNYLKDMKSFINQIQAAIPILSKLLFSKTQTDVLEVISFFVTCYEHGLVDMLFGIRKMLLLVLYAEKTIKDAVINAYKTLYLKPAAATTRDSSVIIAKQLIKLLQDLTVGERDALEELVGEFAVSGELSSSVIKVLWEIFATGGGQTNSNETQQAQNKLQALVLLSMIIKKIPEKGRANINVLIEIGLGYNNQSIDQSLPYIANDLEMLKFRETCLTLSYVAPETNVKRLTQQDTSNKGNEENPANESQMAGSSVGNKKKDKRKNGGVLNESSNHNNTTRNIQNDDPTQTRLQFNNEPFKLLNSHILFERLCQLIVEQMNNLSTIYWTPFVEHALTCIFKLADNPIIIAEQIVNKLIEKIKPFNYMREKLSKPPVPLFNEETSTLVVQQTQEPTDDCLAVNSNILSRFFGFLGILATKVLIFLNQSIVCELKRRKLCKENQSTLSLTKKASLSKQSKRRQSIKNIRHFAPQSSITNDMALEEEMGLAQATEAEDVELIFIEKVINLKVAELNPQPGLTSLLAQFLPIIVVILREPFKYPDQELQLACSLALVKLMILSPKICNDHLQLLFTLVEKSTNCDVRAQLILGIGDLVYRYPNALEPYTSHLYLPLRDTKSTQVRMNTIRVLSHLILKEMIKTRGQIYEIALCTIDPDQRISSLAKLFFQELSQRNNGLVIYNAMPDIISQLSGDGGSNTNTQGDNNSKTSKTRVISEESFHTVVTYLFSFIKRDKQCETLIEKLCHAFRQANTTERKCRDLAFCLTKIQLSENGIKKLKETFKWYADKLCIQNVYEAFKTLIRNARKLPLLKNETKIMLDELEKQIEEIKQKGLSNENNDQEMEQEDVENEEEEEQDVTTSKRPTRNEATNNKQKQNAATASKSILSRKTTANNAATSSKSKTNSKSSKNNKTVNNRKKVKKIESSSDDDDEKSSNESDSSSDLATTDSD